MHLDVEAAKRAQKWGPRQHIRFPGAQIPHAKEARLDAFLAANPGWRAREVAQAGEYLLERLRRG